MTVIIGVILTRTKIKEVLVKGICYLRQVEKKILYVSLIMTIGFRRLYFKGKTFSKTIRIYNT